MCNIWIFLPKTLFYKIFKKYIYIYIFWIFPQKQQLFNLQIKSLQTIKSKNNFGTKIRFWQVFQQDFFRETIFWTHCVSTYAHEDIMLQKLLPAGLVIFTKSSYSACL